LSIEGLETYEVKHSFKTGDLLRFDGADLPSGLMTNHRYFVTETTKSSAWRFNVCGPIVCPTSPLTAEMSAPDSPSLAVLRRSPVARLDNAMLTRFYTKTLFMPRNPDIVTRRNFNSARSGLGALLVRFIHETPRYLAEIGTASKLNIYPAIMGNLASFSAAKPAVRLIFSIKAAHAAASNCST
jgi:hypothetical protein